MTSEKRLYHEIKKIKGELEYAEYFQGRNPYFMHWWQKWKARRISKRNEKLLFDLIIYTVALDPRFRKGDWNIAVLVPELIRKGLSVYELSE
jgi:hypothetical protein